VQEVAVNRREASDFCHKCDYPLYWTQSQIYRDDGFDDNDDSHRRLPGTVGRVTTASLTCPHCAEPNSLSAQYCVRCGQPLHPVAEVPAPVPVYIPPPPPPPAPEPASPTVAWWVWMLLGSAVGAVIVLVVLILNHTIR
jgi:hypothetical protein